MKKTLIVLFVLLIVFIASLIPSLLILNNFNKAYDLKNREIISGIVTYYEIDTQTAFYEYSYSNQDYENLFSGISTLKAGDKIYLLISESQPSNSFPVIMITNTVTPFLIPAVIALISNLIVVIGVVINNSIINKLVKNGKRLNCKIDTIERASSLSYKYYIRVKYEDIFTNEVTYYDSKTISFDPSDFIKDKNIESLNVYVNKENKKDYYVDIRDIK